MLDKVHALIARQRHKALGRATTAAASGVIAALILPERLGIAVRLLAGWNTTALALSGLAWWLILRSDAAETRNRAAADDPGRSAVWALVLIASAVSLFVTTVVLRQARALAPEARDLFVALCLLAVGASWALTHTAYTLRYAHLYYRDDDEGEGGLTFPSISSGGGDEAQPPTYLDFAYFAFTVGMCFQVSDVAVPSRQIRRAVLAHAVLSFAYNTAILAVALNVVIGLFD